MQPPSLDGLLSPNDLFELGRVKSGIDMIRSSIARLNQLAADNTFPVRLVTCNDLSLMSNDISRMMYAHEQAEKRIAAAANKILDDDLDRWAAPS